MSAKCTLDDDYIITTPFSGFGGQLKLSLWVYDGKK